MLSHWKIPHCKLSDVMKLWKSSMKTELIVTKSIVQEYKNKCINLNNKNYETCNRTYWSWE